MRYIAVILLTAWCTVELHAAPTTAGAAKQWATDLPAFLNEHPREHWIVGRSTAAALSAVEAEAAARHDAAEQIADVIGPHTAVARIDAAVRNGDLVVDRQVDAVERPYGTIWRAAVLVDADPKKIDALRAHLQRDVAQHRAAATIALGAASAWMVVVCMGYLLLNWLTRGYFRWRLVIASILLIAAGFVGAAHLI